MDFSTGWGGGGSEARDFQKNDGKRQVHVKVRVMMINKKKILKKNSPISISNCLQKLKEK